MLPFQVPFIAAGDAEYAAFCGLVELGLLPRK